MQGRKRQGTSQQSEMNKKCKLYIYKPQPVALVGAKLTKWTLECEW